jgi:cation:H+ antiporter
MIGLILVSVGTDLPEIANSIIACSSGHGDIDVGDSIGSVLTQITLVLGLMPFIGRDFSVRRRDILTVGSFEVFALILALLVALTGFTRVWAFLLILVWPASILIIRRIIPRHGRKRRGGHRTEPTRHFSVHLIVAMLGFIGVGIGAVAVVQSVTMLREILGIPEFLISFFVLAIGTSLPELVVDLMAIKKKQYELVIGDIVGSCILDATVSISIGQLIFPTAVFYESGMKSISLFLYAIIASIVVITSLALRKKVDKKIGAVFLIIYGITYVVLYLP